MCFTFVGDTFNLLPPQKEITVGGFPEASRKHKQLELPVTARTMLLFVFETSQRVKLLQYTLTFIYVWINTYTQANIYYMIQTLAHTHINYDGKL